MSKVVLVYLLNFVFSLLLIIFRSENLISCSVFVCLLPILLTTFMIGLLAIIIGKGIIESEKEKENGN